MKRKKKKTQVKLISIIIVLIFAVFIFIFINKNMKKETNQIKNNKEEIISGNKLSEVRKIGNIEISNIELKTDGQMTQVSADVYNNDSKSTTDEYIDFEFLDKDGNHILTVGIYVEGLQEREKRRISTIKLVEGIETEAYDCKVTKHEE